MSFASVAFTRPDTRSAEPCSLSTSNDVDLPIVYLLVDLISITNYSFSHFCRRQTAWSFDKRFLFPFNSLSGDIRPNLSSFVQPGPLCCRSPVRFVNSSPIHVVCPLHIQSRLNESTGLFVTQRKSDLISLSNPPSTCLHRLDVARFAFHRFDRFVSTFRTKRNNFCFFLFFFYFTLLLLN